MSASGQQAGSGRGVSGRIVYGGVSWASQMSRCSSDIASRFMTNCIRYKKMK